MRLELESAPASPQLAIPQAVENDLYGDPSDFNEILRSGIAAAQNGDRTTARRLLFQASGIDPKCEDIWMWLASISEYPEELLIFLNNALDINPENRRAKEWHAATRSLLAKTFVQRAIAADQEGSAERAGQCIEQALSYDRECEMAWFWKASFEAEEENKLECLQKVLEINPDNTDAQNALLSITSARSHAAFLEAKSAAVAGRRKKAFDLVTEFLRSEPDNADAWILRSHLSLGLNEKIESLERALQIDPENSTARSAYDFLTATVDSAQEPSGPDPAPGSAADAAPDLAPETGEPALPPTFSAHFEESPAQSPDPTADEDFMLAASVATAELEASSQIDHVDLEVEAQATLGETVEYGSLDLLDIHTTGEPSASDPDHLGLDPEAVPHATESSPVQMYLEDDGVDRLAMTASLCPYCREPNEPQAFACKTCRATLTLSDIESLLSSPSVDRETVQKAVTEMEAEWNLREFSVDELIALGVGHFNLGNDASGFSYIQEAARADPNNVILGSQLNTLAIRLDEKRRQQEAHEAMPKGKTILVVDDSATVRKLISGKLEKSGHNVICAEDGVEALEKLAGGLPDLVLLDITMPRMDGYEVCKQIRSMPEAKDLPVVMISGKDGFFDKVRGRMAGTTGYVTKPFGPETLMKALETYLLPDQVAETFV